MIATLLPRPALAAALAAVALAAAAALPAAAAVGASPYARVFTEDAADGVHDIQDSGEFALARVPTTVTDSALNGGRQRTVLNGTAAPLTQTLRAAVSLGAQDPAYTTVYTAKSNAAFGKRVQVLPGSSGLAWGAPVAVGVTIGLDGRIGVGLLDRGAFPGAVVSADPAARAVATVDVSLSYRIRDLDQLGCAECGPLELLDFGYDARAFFDARPVPVLGDYAYLDSEWSPEPPFASGPRSQNPFYVESETLRSSDALRHDMATGAMTFVLDTFVGNTLEVEGVIDVFVQAVGTGTLAQAAGLFDRSFDAGLDSAVGVVFSNEVAGVTPVPEPAAWALMALGLGVVGWRARRR